jgi:exopolysaccharide biosynthesis WecB/TagA/CpsF family protein
MIKGMMFRKKDLKYRWSKIIDLIKIIDSKAESDDFLSSLDVYKLKNTTVLAFINANAMNMILENDDFFESLILSDVLLRDGSGVSLLYKILKKNSGQNMNGTDFIPEILAAQYGSRIAVWGTEEPYLEKAVDFYRTHYNVEIASVENGFHDNSYYLKLAASLRPDLVILGMGMPKQEKIAEILKNNLDKPMLIICGGAIIDFHGGKISRAPFFLRKWGLEWVYRFWLEPRRMFKRYIVGNPIFIFRALIFGSFN